MRLFELTAPNFFLCTTEARKEGATISCLGTLQLLGAEFEAVLEAKRPSGCWPRQSSIFLSDKPTGTPYTYAVQSVRDVERNHTGWLKLLTDTDPMQTGVMQANAIGYWSGKECPDARSEPWEIRAARVKILRRVGASGLDHTVMPSDRPKQALV